MHVFRLTIRQYCIFLFFVLSGCTSITFNSGDSINIDQDGNDANNGSVYKPVKTITELNLRITGNPLNVYFTGGQTFNGTIVLNNIHGTPSNPVLISTRGRSRAIINGGDSAAMIIENCSNIIISDLRLVGSGRQEGNTSNGMAIRNTTNLKVSNVGARGFQKSGIDLYNCRDVVIRDVAAYNNGFSGINIMGSVRDSSKNIVIKDCTAENNPGDPTRLDNHSGNGILVGISDSVLITRCSATRNGWDMPRTGNGPVGIWAWESSNVKIQYCISYRNRTSKNAKDGGGFDLDGGVTNSVIQYCLSFGNEGAGFGLFQYAGASEWYDNIIRYNASFNDATTTEGAGSIFIWNGSGDSSQMSGCEIRKNLVVNFSSPLISFERDSKHENFRFSGNFFIGRDTASCVNTGSTFRKNVWIGRSRH